MMFGRNTDLSTRSEQLALPGTKDAERFHTILFAEAACDTWRLVELFSQGGEPFEAELAWSAGQGVGAKALVTVSTATRVSVYARSLQIRARNLATEGNQVGVTIADGHTPTHNQWEQHGEVGPETPVIIAVPPFARSVRLDVANPKALDQSRLVFVDGTGTPRATIAGNAQPDGGVPVGGVQQIHLYCKTDTAYRLLFHLSI